MPQMRGKETGTDPLGVPGKDFKEKLTIMNMKKIKLGLLPFIEKTGVCPLFLVHPSIEWVTSP
jgi:hypothetical protein